MEDSTYEEMSDERPEGFEFPPAYLELISHKEEPNLYPWKLFYYQERAHTWSLKNYRYKNPERRLIPFARWDAGPDDRIACFEHVENRESPLVLSIDPFVELELKVWERFASFDDWLAKAREQSREYWANRPELPYVPPAEKLPEGFLFPQDYLDFIKQKGEEPDMYPWKFLCFNPDDYDYYLLLLKRNHPNKKLVPLARWDMNGEMACFELPEGSDQPVIRRVLPFTDIGYDIYPEFEELLHEPYTTFTAWLALAQAWRRLYAIQTTVQSMETSLSDLGKAWDALDGAARAAMEKLQPDFSGKLAKITALFKEEKYGSGLNQYVSFLLQTGIMPQEELISHMKVLAWHCDLRIPSLDALKSIEDNPGGSTIDIGWTEIV